MRTLVGHGGRRRGRGVAVADNHLLLYGLQLLKLLGLMEESRERLYLGRTVNGTRLWLWLWLLLLANQSLWQNKETLFTHCGVQLIVRFG